MMSVGDLVVPVDPVASIGVDYEGGFIYIKPDAPPQIVTKIIKNKDQKLFEAEIYLPWRQEKCRITGCHFRIVSRRRQ